MYCDNVQHVRTTQKNLTRDVGKFYQITQTNDRNLRMAEGGGLVNHHFGLGSPKNLKSISSQENISRALHELELNQIEVLIKTMGTIENTDKILDAGSGRGGTAFAIVNKFNASVDGITIAPYQANFSNALARDYWKTTKAKFSVMDMLKLDFPDNTFNHVITNETTMYIVDLPLLFSGFKRVLVPHGRYTLATWCINEASSGWERISQRIHDNYPGSRMHTKKEYLDALETSGFKIVQNNHLTDEAIPYWKIRSTWNEKSGIESAYLEGHKKRQILYVMVSSESSKN